MNIRFILLLMLAFSATASVAFARGTAPSFHWNQVDYYDLTLPTALAQPYAALWHDKLSQNNQSYRNSGDRRYRLGNAPATEASTGVYGPNLAVIVSTLNTITQCSVIRQDPQRHAILKRCPTRIAVYSGHFSWVFDLKPTCFLEYTYKPGEAPGYPPDSTIAAYDASDNSIRMTTLINHFPIDQCAVNIIIPHVKKGSGLPVAAVPQPQKQGDQK